MGKGKYKKCFQDLSKCQLFLEFPFNINFFFHLFFFFKIVFLPSILLLKIWWEPFLFHSLCFYPTLRPNKVFIWSWRLCSSDIDMTEKKKCGINSFWHPFMRLLVLSWLSIFHVIYMWGVWFCLHYSAHIYIVESVTSHFKVISFVEW